MDITYTEQESKLSEQLAKFAPSLTSCILANLANSIIKSANREVYSLIAFNKQIVTVFELGLGHNFNDVRGEFIRADSIVEIRPDRNKWFRLQACQIKMSRAEKKASELEAGVGYSSVYGMLSIHEDGSIPNQPRYWARWVQKFRDAGNEVMLRYILQSLEANKDLLKKQ